MPDDAGSILPAWAVLPLTAITLIVLAGHVLALQQADIPPRRRRVRTANGIVMMFVAALFGYAVGVQHRSDQAGFLLVWMLIIGLLGIVLMLAGMDALATISGYTQRRRELRDELRQEIARARGGSTSRAPGAAAPRTEGADAE